MEPKIANSPQLYHKVWDILVEHAGAIERDRDGFLLHCLEKKHPLTEWRFQGVLGFGGKVYRTGGRLHVKCYPEDETKRRRKVIDEVNALLSEITPEGGIWGPP
jgi:hypothetical protein